MAIVKYNPFRDLRAMQERGRQCRQGHKAEQEECGGRRQETVKRESRVNGRIGCDRAGRGENAGNVLAWNGDDTGSDLVPPRPLAGRDQERRENRGEKYPDAGTEQAHLDGVANEKNATERERKHAGQKDSHVRSIRLPRGTPRNLCSARTYGSTSRGLAAESV